MPVTVIAGGQWGDEGKGRIVDLAARDADLVVRCQGGPNAGHTVINDRGRFVLHAIPSGIFSARARCIVGAGTVVSPGGLVAEMQALAAAEVDLGRLVISDRAHLVLPYHRLLDSLEEERRGANGIGSTGQGIGPAYVDKAGRLGIRAGDLLDLTVLRQRIREVLPWKNRLLEGLYGHPPVSEAEVLGEVESAAPFLAPLIGDTVGPIHAALSDGKRVLLEGQLGVMRDLDWGAYPYVTSSAPTPAGLAAGAGVPVQSIDRVIGVVKAYTTAVGTGPFPTELEGEEGELLRQKGQEYGATTGRPRRCGWFDGAAVAWAARVAGFSEIALTKIDVLDGMPRIPVCTGYEIDGRSLSMFPTTDLMRTATPIYQEMPGWQGPTAGIRKTGDLPVETAAYIRLIERLAGVPVKLVSVGPEREEILTWSE